MSEPTTPTRELLVRYQAIFQAALSLLQAQNVPNGITEQLASEWQDIRAKLAKLDAEIARRKAEIATVPMAQSREADFKRLVGEGFISSHATQDKTKATQREKLTQLTAPVDGTVQQLAIHTTGGVVTADAVTDDKKGSYYPATLTLAKRTMNIDGKQVAISPGMNVTAEIKTGERRVIEYLLSPIQRAGSESLRER